MGLFGKKAPAPTATLEAYELRRGTGIGMVDVDPQFIDWARANCEYVNNRGHKVTFVALVLDKGNIRVLHEGRQVGRMDPGLVDHYAEDLLWLQRHGKVGVTDAFVKKAGAKRPHELSLNWGRGAFDGGLLKSSAHSR
jgi:hypothetical protein